MKYSILLIDDNPQDRTLIIRELRRQMPDLEVVEVGDESGFADCLRTGKFDLVITDYQLRWTNGLDILKVIKDRYPSMPVIFFTATGTEQTAVEAMKAGLDDYVLKTAQQFAKLPAAVQALLERQESRAVLQVLYRMTAALNQASGLDDICKNALSALQDIIRAECNAILLANAAGSMEFFCYTNIGDEFRAALAGFTPWRPRTENPSPVIISDLAADVDFARRAAALATGMHALAIVPILYRDSLLGMLLVGFETPHYFRQKEMRLIESLASHVAFAVVRTKAEQSKS
jgi:DNA-binding response OmpR family regulator